MKTTHALFGVYLAFGLAACYGGDDTDETKTGGDHVWKEQTDTIEKAKQVDQIVQGAAEQQRRALEEQTR